MIRDSVSVFLSSIMIVLFGGAICLSFLLAAATIYGFAAGVALPTTTIFHLVPVTEKMVDLEPFLSTILLVTAALGAVMSWLASLGALDRQRIDLMESTLDRMMRPWGALLPLCILFIIINSGGWSGHYTGHPSASWGIFNLVPLSDATNYFWSAQDRAVFNAWGEVSGRRPLAQSLRDTLVFFSSYSESATVLLQTVLISLGMALAAGRIIAWKGTWAAVAFVGFSVSLLRGYLGTMMTEPLGWVLAFFSCAYLCDAIRFRSRWHAVVALTGLTLALTVRAGSMLTIPFLIAWVALAFGSNIRFRLRWGTIGVACVVAVFGLNAVLQLMYSPPNAAGGVSFGLTLCGLSVGGHWGDCYYRLYADEIARLDSNDRALAELMLRKALVNIAGDPIGLLFSFARNIAHYLSDLPRLFLAQFSASAGLDALSSVSWRIESLDPRVAPWPWSILVVIALLIAGLVTELCRRGARMEALFWAGLFISTVASAAIIYADDGFRTMQVTYVILAVPLAFAFSSPLRSATAPAVALDWRIGGGVLALVGLLALAIPAASHAIMQRWLQKHIPVVSAGENEAIILGGRTISGFLVMPDGFGRLTAAPSISYSDFRKVAEVSAFKRDYGFDIDDLRIKPPFALISGTRLNQSCCYYITPPDLLIRRGVVAWRLVPVDRTNRNNFREMQAISLP